jgi:hypothetical protein
MLQYERNHNDETSSTGLEHCMWTEGQRWKTHVNMQIFHLPDEQHRNKFFFETRNVSRCGKEREIASFYVATQNQVLAVMLVWGDVMRVAEIARLTAFPFEREAQRESNYVNIISLTLAQLCIPM